MYCTTYFIRINEYRCLKNLLLIDLFVTLYQRLIKSDEHYKLKYEMGMKVLYVAYLYLNHYYYIPKL